MMLGLASLRWSVFSFSFAWVSTGSFLVAACALYGGAMNAIMTGQRLYGLLAVVLMLPLLALVAMCVVLG